MNATPSVEEYLKGERHTRFGISRPLVNPTGDRLAWLQQGTVFSAPIIMDASGKVIALGAFTQATPKALSVSSGTEYGGKSYCWVGASASHIAFVVAGELYRTPYDNAAKCEKLPHLQGTKMYCPNYDASSDTLHMVLEYSSREGMRRAQLADPLRRDVKTLVPEIHPSGDHTFFNDDCGALYSAWDTMAWEDGVVYARGQVKRGPLGSFTLLPCWSPDRTRVSYLSDRDGSVRLYVDDEAVSEPGIDVALYWMWGFGDKVFAWLNDSTLFTFYQVGVDFVPAIIDLAAPGNSRRLERLCDREDTLTLDVNSVAGGSSVVFRLVNSRDNKLVALHLPSQRQTVLFHSHVPPVFQVPPPVRLHFDTGGFRTWGLLYPPVPSADPEEQQGAPPAPPDVFIDLHGGPTSNARNLRSPVVALLQLQGYAVFRPSYRGSLGAGRDFRRALNGAWGAAEVEDCLAALQMLVAGGHTSPRAAVGGVSAGGYSAQSALIQAPEAFVAGVSISGLSRLVADDPNTHLLESRYNMSLIGPEGSPLYEKLEPLPQAGKIVRPLLLIHAADDDVCPIQDSRDMAGASKFAELLEYPKGGHGVRSEMADWAPKMIHFLCKAFKDAK